MLISYLILHYKNADITKNCIESLLHIDLEDSQIVVVDNASQNGSYEKLSEYYHSYSQIHFLYNDKNLGYAAGNNIGFAYAKNVLHSDFIVLLNNDVVINQKNFQSVLISEYKKFNFYVAGPNIITPEGGSQNPFRMELSDRKGIIKSLIHDYVVLFLMKIGIQQKLKKLFHYDGSIFKENNIETIHNFRGTLHGSCLIFSPLFIQRFNGLYGGTFLYCEEEILCYILQKTGLPYSYIKSLKVLHKHSVSMKREIRDEDKRKMVEISNRIVSYHKYLHIVNDKNDVSKYLI